MAVKFAAYESMRQLHKKLNDGRAASPQVCVLANTHSEHVSSSQALEEQAIKQESVCAII